MSQTTRRETIQVSYEEAKAKHKQQSLDSAVQWARSLKLMKAEKAALKFQEKYMTEVLDVIEKNLKSSSEEGFDEIMKTIGNRERFVGKKQEIDGKPYQPIIEFPAIALEDGTTITDPFKVGAIRLQMIMKKVAEAREDIREIRFVEPLLVAKQRFYRYSYNRDVEKMELEHQKISEFESGQLENAMERDRLGLMKDVVFHNNAEFDDADAQELDEIELGMRLKAKEEEHTVPMNGNHIREYGDRIKYAYEIRQSLMKSAAMFKNPTAQDKTDTYSITAVHSTTAEGSIPNLF